MGYRFPRDVHVGGGATPLQSKDEQSRGTSPVEESTDADVSADADVGGGLGPSQPGGAPAADVSADADVGGGTDKGSGSSGGIREEKPVEHAAADVSAGLYACVVCSENVPRYGSRCERCKRNMEEDKLERESGR